MNIAKSPAKRHTPIEFVFLDPSASMGIQRRVEVALNNCKLCNMCFPVCTGVLYVTDMKEPWC